MLIYTPHHLRIPFFYMIAITGDSAAGPFSKLNPHGEASQSPRVTQNGARVNCLVFICLVPICVVFIYLVFICGG